MLGLLLIIIAILAILRVKYLQKNNKPTSNDIPTMFLLAFVILIFLWGACKVFHFI